MTKPKKDYSDWKPQHQKEWRPNPEYPMAALLLRVQAWILRGRCKIIDRDDPGSPVPLVMRMGQTEVFRRAYKQALKRKPIRIIVPKYRRHGISTVCQAIGLGIARISPYRNCRTVAHKEDGTSAIFNIARIMWEQDGQKGEKGKQKEIKPPGMKSSYQCMTGAGHFTSSGDTIHFLHVSELAKFPNTSEQDENALNSMLNAVSQTSPQSMVVLESSGQGSDGVFPDRCRAAYEGKSTYECVFLPWLMDKSLAIDEDELPDEFDPPLAGDELTLRDAHGATDGQLAWRRQKLDDDFPGSGYAETPPKFGWDFPVVLEDCFGEKKGRIYPGFSRKKHVGTINRDELSPQAYKTRFIDWGGSENHAFVCLWCLIDPMKPPQLIVDESCVHTIAEFEKYARDPKTGKPLKIDDHTCFSGETEVMVRGLGWAPIKDLVGIEGDVWTPAGWRPFWNVHSNGLLNVVETTFEDGSIVRTTGDHRFATSDGWKEIDSVCVGDILLTHEETPTNSDSGECRSDRNFGSASEVQRKSVSSSQRRDLLFERPQTTTSCCVGVSLRKYPKPLSHPSHRRKCFEQSHFESSVHLGPGSSQTPLENEAGGRDRRVSSSSCRKGATGRRSMAQVRRRAGLPQMAWAEIVGECSVSRQILRGLWDAVQDSGPEKHRQILLDTLQGSKSEKKTKRVASKRSAGIREVFDLSVDNAHCVTLRNGIVASNCDALRDGVTTLNSRCLVYVYRELYETNPSAATHTILPRKIHQMSGWVHPSGDPDHPNIAAYEPGPDADIFSFGGDVEDERFDYGRKYGDDTLNLTFREAMRMGAGVADAAQYRSCIDYTEWGIPLIPHVKPPGPTQSGYVEDGINFVSVLIAGDTTFRRDKPPTSNELSASGHEKLRMLRPRLPTDEEFEAMRRDRGIIPFADEDEFEDAAIRY